MPDPIDLNTIHDPAPATSPPYEWGQAVASNFDGMKEAYWNHGFGLAGTPFPSSTWTSLINPLTITFTRPGIYLLEATAMFEWKAGADGAYLTAVHFLKNGAEIRSYSDQSPPDYFCPEIAGHVIYGFSAGDTAKIEFWNSYPTGLTLLQGRYNVWRLSK